MPIRTIRDSEALDAIWEELVFTEARLLGDEKAKAFAQPIVELLARLEQVRQGQLGAWREEVSAQANVEAVDDALDDWVEDLDTAMLAAVGRDAQSPRYRRYFTVAPSSITRLGLESELARVRPWAESLVTETEPQLQELGARLKRLIADGDVAIERRRHSASTRTDHRVRFITALIDDINGARRSLYGSLIQVAATEHLASDWANRFFRRSSRGAKASPVASAPQASTAHPLPNGNSLVEQF